MKRAFIKKLNKNQIQNGKGKSNNKNKSNKNNDKPKQSFDDANDY